MRELAQYAQNNFITEKQAQEINVRLAELQKEVIALDEKSITLPPHIQWI